MGLGFLGRPVARPLLLAIVSAIAVVVALTLAVPAPGISAPTAPASARQAAVVDLAFGSYNISGVHRDGQAGGNRRPWRERRPTVVSDILDGGLAVVGVQEAYNNAKYANRLDYGVNQYLDLKEALRLAGGSYAIVDEDPETTRTTRIFYDNRLVAPVASGHHLYGTQPASYKDRRSMAWAIFSVRATGQRFFFSTTHLMTRSPQGQKSQWREMINQIQVLRQGLPVIATGDFQKSKKDQPAIRMLREMKRAGFADVVGQKGRKYKYKRLRAMTTTNAWINSTNHWNRKVRDYSNRKSMIANNIDYVFASNELPVLEWEVCVRLVPGKKKLAGVIPSDHFLVRAVVRLSAG